MTDNATTIATAVEKLNAGDVVGYATSLYSPDAVFHGFPAAFPPTRAGIIDFFSALVAAVPDACISARDLLSDGDRVALRFALTGTHTGDLFGNAATGRAIEAEGITIVRFEGDQVAERWNRLDDLSFLTQLGALPVAASA
ncbi:hypothetical protein BH11ACT8_BH11ACT8_05280 [soil metagenome]